ncbi:MAG: calcium/sodium antiporter [Flavobacteriaceae bacterium]|nr:calcium/sodium antiporter [Flavobacteriaceae bacterium]
MNTLLILSGLALLVIGGEYLVRASIALSFRFRLSKMVIGLTVVSFATSSPELLVSIQAALDGFSDISLGNVIGSNIANLGLVLGLTALIAPLYIDKDFYKFNWPVMMLFSIALYFILANDRLITQKEGIGLLLALAIYLYFLIQRARKNRKPESTKISDALSHTSYSKIIIWLIIGGLALFFGADFLVKGAVRFAIDLGVSERVISITMIAVGTSVPELAASIIAAAKGEKALSLGNLIGSNIFNIASVLGITAIIKPIAVNSDQILSSDMFWMIGFAAILIPLAFIPKKFVLGRYKGLLIFAGYLVFIALAFLN